MNSDPNFPEYISQRREEHRNKKRLLPCSVAGVEYKFILEASRVLEMLDYEVKRRLASFDYPDYVCATIPKKTSKYGYMVDGKKYLSSQEIADEEGLSKKRIRQKMNDPKMPGYHKLKRGSLIRG